MGIALKEVEQNNFEFVFQGKDVSFDEDYLLRANEAFGTFEKAIRYIFADKLTGRSMRNKSGKYVNQNQYGYVKIASRNKKELEDPSTHEYARSYESLFKKINEKNLSFYRMNLSYSSCSHTKEDLRWVLNFVLDFDLKHLACLNIHSFKELMEYFKNLGLPIVLVVKTPSGGYQVTLPLAPSRVDREIVYRYDNVLKSLAKIVGSDLGCASVEHFVRVPNATNVLYFQETSKPYLSFYEEFIKKHNKKLFVVKENNVMRESAKKQVFGKYMKQPAMQKLLNGKFETGIKNNGIGEDKVLGRNNLLFTVGLGLFADGESYSDAEKALMELYSKIDQTDFEVTEVLRCLDRAYSGKYKAPQPFYVEALSGMKFRPLTPPKARGNRQHHFWEIKQDLINYLSIYYAEQGNELECSQPELAKKLSEYVGMQISVDSLKKVIRKMKETGELQINLSRKGSSFVSTYILMKGTDIKEVLSDDIGVKQEDSQDENRDLEETKNLYSDKEKQNKEAQYDGTSHSANRYNLSKFYNYLNFANGSFYLEPIHTDTPMGKQVVELGKRKGIRNKLDLTSVFPDCFDDRWTRSKLVHHYLCYLKSEYDSNPSQLPQDLVNSFLNYIELPEILFKITVVPTFSTIYDLLRIADHVWNNDFKHFPKADITLRNKMPCQSLKMLNYAKNLLKRNNINLEIGHLSKQEIGWLIKRYKVSVK